MAEGSFGIKWKSNQSAFFSISQTNEPLLIEAIQCLFGFNYELNSDNNHFALQTTSVVGVQAIINYFLLPTHLPLVGADNGIIGS